MPTRVKRLRRRLRSRVAVIWYLATALWVGTILWSQQPWRGIDQAQLTLWTVIGITGVLVGGLQVRGKDYWPANLLLGLAAGAPSVMYVAFAQFIFGGNLLDFRAWAGRNHLGVWAFSASFLLMLWALYLVIRVNRAKSGSSINLAGGTGPPTREQALEALHTLTRARRHDVLNLLTYPEFRELTNHQGYWVRDPAVAARVRRLLAPKEGDEGERTDP